MYTLGADPEIFLRDKGSKKVVASCGLFGGTKKRPKPMQGLPKGYAFQEDNVMLEFNIPPATNSNTFDYSINDALDFIKSMLADTHSNLEVAPGCEYTFSADDLKHPKAKEFGCAPDFNAYEVGEAYRRLGSEDLISGDLMEYRFAGGHIHLGYSAKIPPYIAAQFCDAFIGLRSVANDNQPTRRRFYGQAGRYRPTAYGIEYRTLSNYWIFNKKHRKEIAYTASYAGQVFNNIHISRLQEWYSTIPWLQVQEAINSQNAELSSALRAYIMESAP